MSTPSKHRGLGRGLDALIKEGATRPGTHPAKEAAKPAAAAPHPAAAAAKGPYRLVPVHKIQKNPRQPRQAFEEQALRELADSIREQGVIQPVLLRQMGEELFELIAGERRWRAAQMAGLMEIPALLQEATDIQALERATIENLQREDLNPVEEAENYRGLMALAALTQEEVAQRLGKARATVANALRLLELSGAIKRALAEGVLSVGHAKVLLGVDPKERDLLAARVVAQGLSVRALEKLVAGLGRPKPGKKKDETGKGGGSADEKTAKHLKFLADRMQQELGTKVMLTPSRPLADGKREMGRIVIEFFDNEDLSRLLETLNLGDLA
ncbi:MAG TPA: chromosome partitioning protein ParB [Verrucomicrobia bacterium]|nr:chromosome partitioning protein ParB [Verrucomicrobiota bacterium]